MTADPLQQIRELIDSLPPHRNPTDVSIVDLIKKETN